jgi:hypothetical protein
LKKACASASGMKAMVVSKSVTPISKIALTA